MDQAPAPFPITIKPRGTIILEGPVIIRDPEGNEIPQPTPKHPGIVKLCGCGRSQSRPFCDGSHKLVNSGR